MSKTEMAGRKGQKRPLILISLSSDEEEEEQSQEESQSKSASESEEEEDDNDVYDFEDSVADTISSSTSCDDGDGDGDDDDDDDDDESESDDQEYEEDESSGNEDLYNNDDDENICDRVLRLLREGSDLQELNLAECKAYLRKHGLRLSGSKAECIQRIKEHWRIKDRNGEKLYARSSFTINCTGDVCKGDVVLFTQKVYQKFDKATRRGKLLGKRTIAGRIIKESYGAAKQQHTFTVEVLWSKGIKKLPPLFPLLVKGRNLYKYKTFRQRWKNEAERSKVLAEKHKRGAAARHVRAMKKTEKTSCSNAGAKRQKHHHHKPSQTKQTTKRAKGKCVDRRENVPKRNVKSNDRHRKPLPVGQVNLKKDTSTSYRRHQNLTYPNKVGDPPFHSYRQPPRDFLHSRNEFHHQRPPLGSTSYLMRLPLHFRPYTEMHTMPASERQGFNRGIYPHHAYSHPTYESEPKNFNRFPGLMNTYRPLHPFPSRPETYEQRKYGL